MEAFYENICTGGGILTALFLSFSLIFFGCGGDGGSSGGDPTPTLKSLIASTNAGGEIDLGTADYLLGDNESITLEKAITIKSGNVKGASFTIKSDNTKLENLTNVKSVTTSEYLGNGSFTIKDCGEVEVLYVYGGGSSSIHIIGTIIKKLVVNKADVRIALDGANAKIEKAFIYSNCKIESESAANTVENIVIAKTISNLTLAGETKIEKIVATEDATVTAITVPTGSNVKIAAADSAIAAKLDESNKDDGFDSGASASTEDCEEASSTLIPSGDKTPLTIRKEFSNRIQFTFDDYNFENEGKFGYNFYMNLLSSDNQRKMKIGDRYTVNFKCTLESLNIKGVWFAFVDNNNGWTSYSSEGFGVNAEVKDGEELDVSGTIVIDKNVTYETSPLKLFITFETDKKYDYIVSVKDVEFSLESSNVEVKATTQDNPNNVTGTLYTNKIPGYKIKFEKESAYKFNYRFPVHAPVEQEQRYIAPGDKIKVNISATTPVALTGGSWSIIVGDGWREYTNEYNESNKVAVAAGGTFNYEETFLFYNGVNYRDNLQLYLSMETQDVVDSLELTDFSFNITGENITVSPVETIMGLTYKAVMPPTNEPGVSWAQETIDAIKDIRVVFNSCRGYPSIYGSVKGKEGVVAAEIRKNTTGSAAPYKIIFYNDMEYEKDAYIGDCSIDDSTSEITCTNVSYTLGNFLPTNIFNLIVE